MPEGLREVGEAIDGESSWLLRGYHVAEGRFHPQTRHQLADQVEECRIHRGGMTKRETTGYLDRGRGHFDFEHMAAIFHCIEGRSGRGDGLVITSGIRELAD